MDKQQKDISNMSPEEKRELLKQLLEKRRKGSSAREEQISYPLSAGQKGLWMIYQFAPDNYAYNTPCAFRIQGTVQTDALKKAFEHIVLRHSALRTRIQIQDEEPVNIIGQKADLFFEMQNIAHFSEADIDAYLKSKVREPFDLEKGPLMRVYLFSQSDTEHILLLNLHHIIFDGTSILILLSDLMQLYDADLKGKPAILAPLKFSYKDFVTWQAEMLASTDGIKHKAYWHQKLSGELPVLNLPTDRPRPPVQTYKGDVYAAELSPELSGRIKKFAEQEKVSEYSVLLSVYKTLLYRYTQQDDILVGTPVEGRPRTEFEDLIGYFVNMAVIRTYVSGDLSFRELLKQVQTNTLEAMEHGDYPFAELVWDMGLHQDRSQSPLFQVGFAFQNWAKDVEQRLFKEEKDEELVLKPVLFVHQEGEFDFTLETLETESRYLLFFKYNPDLFDEATIARMAGHFQILTEGAVSDPGQSLSKLPLLTQAERRQLLTEWNNTRTEYPKDKCIHQLFEEQAELTPDAVAVVFEDRKLTYRELNARANQLAHYLRSLEVRPDALVGLCAERSLEMVVGVMGILKAGGAYVPLDPSYPNDRLAFMIEDIKTPVLLTQNCLIQGLPEHKARILCLDTDWEVISQESMQNPVTNMTDENLAYVIYTSGSTGSPKGVQISHRAIRNHMIWMQAVFPLTQTDKVLQKTPFSFDASIWEFYAPLLTGAQLIMALPGGHQDSDYLIRTITEQQITILQLVPSLLRMLLEGNGFEDCNTLKRLFCGGEILTADLQNHFFTKNKNTTLINLYGPTEATIDATFLICSSDFRQQTASIGHPVSNTQIYILDRSLQPTPIGVPGELHIGGAGLARGYLNRPELTKEKFIPNPFSNEPGSRLYKTGDLARYLPDGNIEFLGRIDNQVKLRGFRIELGEIEAVLTSHPDVRDAAVIVREDQPGDKRLAAYAVLNRDITQEELRSFLKEKLPDYMVPSAVVILDALPLTPNGKVDRRALPAPDPSGYGIKQDYAGPRTSDEEILSVIWSEVLGLERIGINDNFFDIGGNSLTAVRLVSRLRKDQGISVPVSALFQAPTIAGLARYIREQKTSDTFTPLVRIQPKGENIPFFCVHPGDGNVFCFTELVRQLGNNQPFYGLQASGLEPGTEPISDFREMAAKYIEAVRTVRPKGPYLLGGLCAGGTIAFEMAHQLRDQGQDVPLLVLFDSLAPHLYSPVEDVRYFMGFARDFDGLSNTNIFPLYCEKRNLVPDSGIDEVHRDIQTLSHEERLHILWECAREAGILPPDIGEEYLDRVFKVYSGVTQGLLSYTAQPYEGRAVLMRASESMAEQSGSVRGWIDDPASLELVRKFRDEPVLGWGNLASLEEYEVPGNHFTMLLQPHVKILSEKLKQCLPQV